MAKCVPGPVTGALSKPVHLRLNMPKLSHSDEEEEVLESSSAEILLHLSTKMRKLIQVSSAHWGLQ